MFLETEVEVYPPNIPYTFRLRESDAKLISAWQSQLNAALPSGSSFKLMFGYNGNGVIEYSMKDTTVPVYIEYTEPPNNFTVPLGMGATNWPTNITPHKQYTVTDLAKDPLWKYYLNTLGVRDLYWWTSHTYTHENLSNCR